MLAYKMSDPDFSERDGLDPPAALSRPPYRPPIGMPEARENRAPGFIVSIALHAVVILLILAGPMLFAKVLDDTIPPGAGGPGPAGGGGGGTLGTGSRVLQERLQYLHVVKPVPVPVVETPVVPPPVVPPPEEKKQEEPPPVEQPPPAAANTGTGGGTGADGTAGTGPGTGGGVGSGSGTGTGSGIGPGTGGGGAEIHPPELKQLALLPLPVPNKVRPYTMVAHFDVDERGNSRLIGFNPSKDGGYNRRILDMLKEIRFRPAVRGDGTPVRDTAIVKAIAP